MALRALMDLSVPKQSADIIPFKRRGLSRMRRLWTICSMAPTELPQTLLNWDLASSSQQSGKM